MRLHIFNPEHDMALAADRERFTAPHAGRRMRADLGYIPALWADDGDMVLVDDVEAALESVRHLGKYAHDVMFVTLDDLTDFERGGNEFGDGFKIEPWGWNRTLVRQLSDAANGLVEYMPDSETLASIRRLSNRRFAAENLLPHLVGDCDGTVGASVYCSSVEDALAAINRNSASVLKAPWSCSGRGVRYVQEGFHDQGQLLGWIRNVVDRQHGIMVEPLYPKVYDFGMEFMAHADGSIEYLGLSLFDTRGSAYMGSLCATERDKRNILSHYVDLRLLDSVCHRICRVLSPMMQGIYDGPFGVDMMAVAKTGIGVSVTDCVADGFLLHPCVELNLRRTMGHVALALTPTDFEPQRPMTIYYADKYRLRVQNINDNLLNTGLV